MLESFSWYVALAVFGFGLSYKISTWFRYTIGIEAMGLGVATRLVAAVRGILASLCSRAFLRVSKAFFGDVLLQWKLFRQDRLRWFAHLCIFVGFSGLFFMHAMAKHTTAVFFPAYLPTLNPYLFLRDLFGAMVLVGLAIAIGRRLGRQRQLPSTTKGDVYAIAIVAVIVVSGVCLEGAKTTSYSAYQEMVESYVGGESDLQLKALEAYWVEEFAVASPTTKGPFDAGQLARGQDLHRESCRECHAQARWGFLGYGMAKAMGPFALAADRANLRSILLVMHYLACFLGLALLPFSKMLHIFTSPLNLLVNAGMPKEQAGTANVATRQILELDACTHCGLCTEHCAVAVAFGEIPNVNILPSEKIASLKRVAAGLELTSSVLATIQQGMFLCTNCYRCTGACPVGINLQSLWFNVRERLLENRLPEFLLLSPFSLYRGLMQPILDPSRYKQPLERTRKAIADACGLAAATDRTLPLQPGKRGNPEAAGFQLATSTFRHCYSCMTCSNACPVVQNYSNPVDTLGLLPHQIMHAVGMRLWDPVLSCRMLWDCLGCYQCQEHCPMEVRPAEIIYELKNLAIEIAMSQLRQAAGGKA